MSFSSNVPPRTQSVLSVAISAVRQSATYLPPTSTIPSSSNTNNIFLLLAFNGHGAELVKQEAADPSSDLRVVVQSACEYDLSEMIRHLNVSVHNIRAIAGAPATSLALRQKLLDSSSSSSSSSSLSGSTTSSSSSSSQSAAATQSLLCGIMIRTTSPQQCKAISISLKAAAPNPNSYHHLQKVIARVCRSRPTRLFGDVKARTPYVNSSSLFVSLCRMEEISQNVSQQPRWFADFFASPSHMIRPSEVERFLVDDETANQRAREMIHSTRTNVNSSFANGGQTLHVDYRQNNYNNNNQQHQSFGNRTIDEERFYNSQQHQNTSSTTMIVASDEDAMFVPRSRNARSSSHNNQMLKSSLSADRLATSVSNRDPIVLSRHVM